MFLFTATILLSAALLFFVQPMVGKLMLPLFGGSPAVWLTSLVFFQLALVAGYAYTHAAVAWLGVRRQMLLHLAVLATPFALLPVHLSARGAAASSTHPLASVFLVLLSSIGLPVFALATSGPLLQRWFGETAHARSSDPYCLYAASNVGSLGALLAYPVAIEPLLRLNTQARVWTAAYILLAAMTAACAVVVWRTPRGASAGRSRSVLAASGTGWQTRLRWVALAAVPSSLMLSVTGHITTDIAAVPLLWIIPLATYLVTFVLTFARRQLISHALADASLPFVVVIPLLAVAGGMREPLGFIAFHLLALFAAAMVCHGELARTRPQVEDLTGFYVWISLGGAAGGLFNALLAPLLFRTLAEYPIGLVAACLLRPRAARSRRGAAALWAAVALLTLGLECGAQLLRLPVGSPVFVLFVLTVPFIMALASWRHPERSGPAVGAVALVAMLYPNWGESLVASERSFYGVHRIVNRGSTRVLLNGTTLHGAQSLRPPRRCEPLSYYYPTGPLGDLFSTFTGPYAKSNIGVIGLGIGSTGGYARPEQQWTFYEINPVVERIARDPRYFTFLRDCASQAQVVIGDARLSLERQPDRLHDLMIVDAFSSDAIPVHLVTQEALALYLRKLAPRGVLAFHVSNRYLDLEPVLSSLSTDAGLVGYVRVDSRVDPVEAYEGKVGSSWVMLARKAGDLGPLARDPRWRRLVAARAAPWSDQYSNVAGALRLSGF